VFKSGACWRTKLSGHAGEGVMFLARDPHGEVPWTRLGHGEWLAQLSRSTNGGATWIDAIDCILRAGHNSRRPAQLYISAKA